MGCVSVGLGTLALWAMVAAPQGAGEEWPTYHGGYSLDGVAAEAPLDRPARLWKFEADGPVELPPVAGGGKVFVVASKGKVLAALDRSGRPVWKAGPPGDPFATPPLYVEGRVVVGTEGGALHAFDAASGRELWSARVAGRLQGTPNRVDLGGGKVGIVAISQSDGSLRCVDLEKGAEVWKTPPLERCDGSAGVAGGWVVLGSCASALHVFKADRGEKAFDVELGEDSQVAGGVAVSKGVAFAGTRGGRLVAVDVAAGRLLWANGDNTSEAFTTPAVNDRFVVFGASDGRVHALKRATGERVWTFDAGRKPQSPAIAGNRVVVSAGGTLYLLDLEKGDAVWREEVADELTSPALVGGAVIVGADDGAVVAFGRR
jgi:outer membrane protein assembly factor BamB